MTFKTQLAKNTPAQHNIQAITSAVNQGNQFLINTTGYITQGTGISNRIGDSVYLEAINFNVRFNNDPAINTPIVWKFGVMWSGDEKTANVATYATPTTADSPLVDWTLLGPTDGDIGMTIWNSKAITKLADVNIELHEVLAGQVATKQFNLSVPLKQQFKYDKVAGTYGKFKNLYIFIKGFDIAQPPPASTLQIGGYTVTWDLIFKNI